MGSEKNPLTGISSIVLAVGLHYYSKKWQNYTGQTWQGGYFHCPHLDLTSLRDVFYFGLVTRATFCQTYLFMDSLRLVELNRANCFSSCLLCLLCVVLPWFELVQFDVQTKAKQSNTLV